MDPSKVVFKAVQHYQPELGTWFPAALLANSQNEDFSRRLAGSGLRLALYTGDTVTAPDEAIEQYRQIYGREAPFDSEVISRTEIRANPPDILMTNYVQLELLLTRFEDRILFSHREALQFLVMDEVHVYNGKRGADVASLIRRLKQHTGTIGKLRCLATSATVQSGEGEDAATLISQFTSNLFGEPFYPEDVISESFVPGWSEAAEVLPPDIIVDEEYLEAFDGTLENALPVAEALLGRPLTKEERSKEGLGKSLQNQKTLHFLENALSDEAKTLDEVALQYQETYRPDAELPDCRRELEAAMLVGITAEVKFLGRKERWLAPKLHAFFSQGRAITGCLHPEDPHLNDRGEQTCPVCTEEGRTDRPTFPMVFCRGCGQEYYGVGLEQVDDYGAPIGMNPRDINTVEFIGTPAYLYPAHWDPEEVPIPQSWLTDAGNVKSKYKSVIPQNKQYCPECNEIESQCAHLKRPIAILEKPLLLCPSCGVIHDFRPKEFSKLFTFGSVGRSTATDVLVSSSLGALPKDQRQVIAFSDNRQDTALQASHMNSLHRRMSFRRALNQALQSMGTYVGSGQALSLSAAGPAIYKALESADTLPEYRRERREFGVDTQAQDRYERYLGYGALLELEATHRRIHQNLEDVGLIHVDYFGLNECAESDEYWADVPILNAIDKEIRHDYLRGFLDIMRWRLAIDHEAFLEGHNFSNNVLKKLNEESFFHGETKLRPIGFSDSAPSSWRAKVFRFTGSNTSLVSWTKRALNLEYTQASELIPKVVSKLVNPKAAFLVDHDIKLGYHKQAPLAMVNQGVLRLQLVEETKHTVCPRCNTLHHFLSLDVCTGTNCHQLQRGVDMSENYFRREYVRPMEQAVPIYAAEHSGQLEGDERKEVEQRFKDIEDPLNVIVCTPTMELGIDIGTLSNVYMRNVPPNPSNYAQRAGRAGRSGQPSLITVFCGVGSYRGPHDQYFYRWPERIIAGKIAPPRFLLDNKNLLRTHIHSLVFETLGRHLKLPTKPREALDIQRHNGDDFYPLFNDLRESYENAIQGRAQEIHNAVLEAFSREVEDFDWFDEKFIQKVIGQFVSRLDSAFDRWRVEYQYLTSELEEINRRLGKESPDFSLNRRRTVIEHKLDTMRDGKNEWYVYRYLGAQGFLPNYAFPREATTLSFADEQREMPRDPVIALTEYAPGNFIYFNGQRHEVTHARPRTREMVPETFQSLTCPDCARIYIGQHDQIPPVCEGCDKDLRERHPKTTLEIPDMFAVGRAHITADEEERLRKGYETSNHFETRGMMQFSRVSSEVEEVFRIGYEHQGHIVKVNHGPRQGEVDEETGEILEPSGFVLCSKCHRWLLSEKTIEKHVATSEQAGDCPQKAKADDLMRMVEIHTSLMTDVIEFRVPLPGDVPEEKSKDFYVTLGNALLQSIAVTMDLDNREINGFNAPDPDNEGQFRIIIYETEEGGAGALASLVELPRLKLVLHRAREILHEDDPTGGCEKACYECLCSFYNQRDHEILDRNLVLPWLQSLTDLTIETVADESQEDRYADLLSQCESNLEREVLQAIRDRGMRLPDEAQKTIYIEDAPIARADFFYKSRVIVFVDGSPHHLDYVQAADDEKRKKLRSKGYFIAVIRPESRDEDLGALSQKI